MTFRRQRDDDTMKRSTREQRVLRCGARVALGAPACRGARGKDRSRPEQERIRGLAGRLMLAHNRLLLNILVNLSAMDRRLTVKEIVTYEDNR
jgi:hypothetical protein